MTINENPIVVDDPKERQVQALMLKFLRRKRNIQPNVSDGFLTTNNISDSESSGTSGIGS